MRDFLQLTLSGVSLGFLYALVAVSITVILRASGVLSLFQGGIAVLGGYLSYSGAQLWGLPFAVAVLLALVICAAINVLMERLVLRGVSRTSEAGAVFVTFGLLLLAENVAESIWGSEPLDLGDPWGLSSMSLLGLSITQRDAWSIGLSVVALLATYLVFNHTRVGLSMRANASDPIAAAAQGISPNVVLGVSWAIAGVLGALAGVFMATAVGGGARPDIAVFVFTALPAIYLGGVGSPLGSVVGGVVIGLAQQYAAGYAPGWLGQGFSVVFPFVILIIVLLVRPQGIFGSRLVRRA